MPDSEVTIHTKEPAITYKTMLMRRCQKLYVYLRCPPRFEMARLTLRSIREPLIGFRCGAPAVASGLIGKALHLAQPLVADDDAIAPRLRRAAVAKANVQSVSALIDSGAATLLWGICGAISPPVLEPV